MKYVGSLIGEYVGSGSRDYGVWEWGICVILRWGITEVWVWWNLWDLVVGKM